MGSIPIARSLVKRHSGKQRFCQNPSPFDPGQARSQTPLGEMTMHMQTFSGIVIHGNKRGRLLNFPTANVLLSINIPEGIYISETTYASNVYPSLTFIGEAKTYNEHVYQSETYLLDFDQDIYDKQITVHILKKLRDNQKFDSEKALVSQMEKDKIKAEEYFKKKTA